MTKLDIVICVNNGGYAASLREQAPYVAYPDAEDDKLGLLRIKDESGETYLYPKSFFKPYAESVEAKMQAMQASLLGGVKGKMPKAAKKQIKKPKRGKTAA